MSEPSESGPLDKMDLARLIKAHYGNHLSTIRLTMDDGVRFLLYDAFVVDASPDNYGSGGNWGFGVIMGHDLPWTELLGKSLTILSTVDEIVAALNAIDDYVRLRLGPEYLAAYERTRQ